MKHYIIVLDIRSDKKYLDHIDSMIRNFETIIGEYKTKQDALEAHPTIIDITL